MAAREILHDLREFSKWPHAITANESNLAEGHPSMRENALQRL